MYTIFQIVTMSDFRPVCILHRTAKGKYDETLKQFTEQSWSNVKEAEKLRKERFKNSQFFYIIIPDEYVLYMCYHSSCCKTYTAVPKQIDNFESNVVEKYGSTLRSEVDHPGSNSSRVFEPEYDALWKNSQME